MFQILGPIMGRIGETILPHVTLLKRLIEFVFRSLSDPDLASW